MKKGKIGIIIALILMLGNPLFSQNTIETGDSMNNELIDPINTSIKTKNLITKNSNYITLTPFSGSYSGTLITHEIAKYYENIGDNLFIGHTLIYNKLKYDDYSSGDFVGGEVVRFGGANLYKLIDGMMVDQEVTIMNSFESEFVLYVGNWVGGYHGNEFMSKVYFIVDNEIINIDGSISTFNAIILKPCTSFRYQQRSEMNSNTTHLKVAERSKVNSFMEGGFEVETKVLWTDDLKRVYAYAGLLSINKDCHEYVLTDYGDLYKPVGDGKFLVENDLHVRNVYYQNGTNGLMLKATNEIYGDLDETATIKIWDRGTDTKYYRQTAKFKPSTGDLFITKTKLTITYEDLNSLK